MVATSPSRSAPTAARLPSASTMAAEKRRRLGRARQLQQLVEGGEGDRLSPVQDRLALARADDVARRAAATACLTASSGSQTLWSPLSRAMAVSADREMGMVRAKRAPAPGVLSRSRVPRSSRTTSSTTLSPTPRPDTSSDLARGADAPAQQQAAPARADPGWRPGRAGTGRARPPAGARPPSRCPRPSSPADEGDLVAPADGAQLDAAGGGLAGGQALVSGSMPWATALRTTCSSAARTRDRTCASSRASPARADQLDPLAQRLGGVGGGAGQRGEDGLGGEEPELAGLVAHLAQLALDPVDGGVRDRRRPVAGGLAQGGRPGRRPARGC